MPRTKTSGNGKDLDASNGRKISRQNALANGCKMEIVWNQCLLHPSSLFKRKWRASRICKTSSIAHSWWSFVMLYARTNGSESAHGGLFAAGAGVCHRFSQACPCFDHHAWFPHQGFVDFIPVCSGNWLRPVGMWRHHIPTTIHHHNNISPPQYFTTTVTPLWRCGELCLCDGRGFILIIWRSGGPHCQRCCGVIF